MKYNKAHYGNTISEARRKADMTQQELGQILGINKNIVTHWEAGRVKPDLNLVPQLCDALHLTLEAFFQIPSSQDGLSTKEQQLLASYRALSSRDKLVFERALQKATDLNQAEFRRHCQEDFVAIYLNDQSAAAGAAAMLDAGNGTPVYVRKSRASLRAREMITVNGDSMRPRFQNGDVVFVEDAADVRIGEIGVFVVNGAGYIKQRQADCLHSLNPSYPDIPLRETDDVRCYGRVLGTVSPEDYPTPEEQAILEEIKAQKPTE